MFKYCFAIIFSLMVVSISFAADKIYLNNGLVIDGTIIQIDINSVTVKYGDKELTRTLHKDAIKVIIYEDGTAETFPKVVVAEPKLEDNRDKRLEQRVTAAEVKAAASSGVMTGIGFCIVLALVLIFV